MKKQVTPNKMLLAARLKRGWDQRRAADAARVGEKTYRNWESGRNDPTLDSLEQLTKGFGATAQELGYAYLVELAEESASPEEMPNEPEAQDAELSFVPAAFLPIVDTTGKGYMASTGSSVPTSNFFDPTTQCMVRIIGLVGQWRGRAVYCAELQALLSQEFTMMVRTQEQGEQPQGALSRRQALIAIAALPYGLVAAVNRMQSHVVVEEFLPQCTASITACWHLMEGKEFLVVEQSLAQYLPALTALAQQSSPYQRPAAALASQGYFISNHLAMHRLRFRDRVLYSKQAIEYGQLAGDPVLTVSAMATLGDAYHQVGDLSAQLRTYQQAEQQLEGLPLVLQSKVRGGLAHAYAQQGQVEEVTRALGEARVILTPEAQQESLPLYLAMDYGPVHAMQFEQQAWLDLGDRLGESSYYQQAAEAFQVIDTLPDDLAVPERIKVEVINQKTLVAVRQGELEKFSTLLSQGIQGAKELGSDKRREEVIANWKTARKQWPQERQVTELADLLLE